LRDGRFLRRRLAECEKKFQFVGGDLLFQLPGETSFGRTAAQAVSIDRESNVEGSQFRKQLIRAQNSPAGISWPNGKAPKATHSSTNLLSTLEGRHFLSKQKKLMNYFRGVRVPRLCN
jgi:hypothetical protein